MDKSRRYLEIFTPGAPVIEKKYFIGRDYEVSQLEDVIFSRGMSSIIYGPRGIGKTTLALQAAIQSGSMVVRESCSPQTNYEGLAKRIVSKVRNSIATGSNSTSKGTSAEFSSISSLSSESIATELESSIDLSDPSFLADVLSKVPVPITIIIDEMEHKKFDNVFIEALANLIKKSSDYSVDNNVTFFLVGVAKNVHDVFSKHLSVQRCLKELLVSHLKGTHVKEFLDNASKELGFSFEGKLQNEFVGDTV